MVKFLVYAIYLPVGYFDELPTKSIHVRAGMLASPQDLQHFFGFSNNFGRITLHFINIDNILIKTL